MGSSTKEVAIRLKAAANSAIGLGYDLIEDLRLKYFTKSPDSRLIVHKIIDGLVCYNQSNSQKYFQFSSPNYYHHNSLCINNFIHKHRA
ncbi:hypothetical protein QVD17_38373 [Tagetes erecta]|uniref:Uncharacterized protein n=1 Tax=Tagetes erecta TaxID=13708 RepID=A0AAD8JS03_TARER|nr:hypothetical protein QVD17_38373 [Tagetes erecta]